MKFERLRGSVIIRISRKESLPNAHLCYLLIRRQCRSMRRGKRCQCDAVEQRCKAYGRTHGGECGNARTSFHVRLPSLNAFVLVCFGEPFFYRSTVGCSPWGAVVDFRIVEVTFTIHNSWAASSLSSNFSQLANEWQTGALPGTRRGSTVRSSRTVPESFVICLLV